MSNILYLNVIGLYPLYINVYGSEFRPIKIPKGVLPPYALKISKADFDKYAALALMSDTCTGFKHYLKAQTNIRKNHYAGIRGLQPDYGIINDEGLKDDHIDAISYTYASFANRSNSNDTTQTTRPIKLYPKP